MKWQSANYDEVGALPYFTDIHINGFVGIDLLSATTVEEIHQIGRGLYAQGTIGWQPSLITSSPELVTRAIGLIEDARREQGDDEARILGIHLEGPFLSLEMAGTHPLDLLKSPDRDLISKYLASGTITMVTIAPELPGAIELIRFLSQMGVKVSIGHTNATKEIARDAFKAGATLVTHLFNRCSHDLVDVALEESDAQLMLIADGSHATDERISLAFDKAGDRIIATTDAISLAGTLEGLSDEEIKARGRVQFGEIEIEIRDGAAFRIDGVKAGSIATMRSLWERIARVVSPEAATEACATRPATLLGRPELASLEFGYPAQRWA